MPKKQLSVEKSSAICYNIYYFRKGWRFITKRIVKNAAFYIISALLSIVLIWYIAYHLLSGVEKKIETTPAVIATKANNIQLDAYIVRDETVVYSTNTGGVNYLFEDGEKVSTGTVIANIYSGSDAERIAARILEIDNQIEVLEESGYDQNTSRIDTNTMDDKISELYYIIRDKVEDGDVEYAIYRKDELLSYLNKRQVITQTGVDYNSKIESLKNERARLSEQLVDIVENVAVTKPGYFYSALDGYEDVFTFPKLNGLSLSSYSNMVDSEPYSYNSLAIGKIVNSTDWYILSETTQENLKRFNVGESYEVKFPFNSDISVVMKLENIVKENNSDQIVLVFKTNNMPSGFNYLRKQNVQIIEKSYTGYKVPSNAVRVVDGVKGVYVLNGNTVNFKEIEVLVEQDGYYIVKEQPSYLEDEFYYKKLGLYDMIITTGKNLYDGKIISASGGNS